MDLNPEAFAALAAQDAAFANVTAAMLAKSDEQRLRDHIAGQREAAHHMLDLAVNHRMWRRMAVADGLGTLGFFHDEVPALLKAVARHRRSERAARARLAAMLAAQAQRVAA